MVVHEISSHLQFQISLEAGFPPIALLTLCLYNFVIMLNLPGDGDSAVCLEGHVVHRPAVTLLM